VNTQTKEIEKKLLLIPSMSKTGSFMLATCIVIKVADENN
jgi:hypothetical protein